MKQPEVGRVICIRWIDSGAEDSGSPGDAGLVVKTSYGRVTAVGRDEKLHDKVCEVLEWACCCTRVEFVMCSHGEGTAESGTIGAVWWQAVVGLDVLE